MAVRRETPDLSVKHLRAIVTLAQFQSFIAAASDLGLSQPGLSRIVQQAESRLGVTLFVRGSRNVSPTEAGREFIPAAMRVLGELSQQSEKVRTLDGQLRGQLIISSLMSISHHVLPSALVEYRKQHSKMYLHIREGLATDVQEDVRSGLADFGIGNVDALPSGIIAESIAEEPCYVVLPRRHVLAGKSQVKLRDIATEALISMPIGSWLQRRIDVAAHDYGVVLNHSIVTNLFGSQLQFVAAGLGVAIIPAAALPLSDAYPIVVRPLRPVITRRVGVLRLAERPLSMASRTFLDIFVPKFLSVIGRRHHGRAAYAIGAKR